MRPDPINELLGELLEAHDRLHLSAPLASATAPAAPSASAASWGGGSVVAPLRRPRRRLGALVAAALVLTASAAAAVVATIGSAPIAGRLPQLLGSRYSLQVSPDLQAGRAGWCVALLDLRTHDSVLPFGSECVSGSGPLIARGGLAEISSQTGKVRAWLLYAVVNRQVATLRGPDGRRIRPISSNQLPSGWRAAVTIQTHAPRARGRGAVITLTPLDGRGRSLAASTGAPLALPTRAVKATRPPARGCRIEVRAEPGLRVIAARAVRGPLPRSLSRASSYLACYSLAVELGGRAATAAVLIDARGRDRVAPAIAGLRPLPGEPDIWESRASAAPGPHPGPVQRLFARRVAHGWLVLQSPARSAVAVALLRRLTASA